MWRRWRRASAPELSVFGDDYKTPDGTGVRDYIHVIDLAEAHLAALELACKGPGTDTINVGTGQGYSVLEMVEAFTRVTGRAVPYRIVPRRPGDVAIYLADPARAADPHRLARRPRSRRHVPRRLGLAELPGRAQQRKIKFFPKLLRSPT